MTNSANALSNVKSPLFSLDPNRPIAYMDRTRAWYDYLGYDNAYSWAHFNSVPFQPLKKPLSEMRLTILTTAAPYDPDKGDQGPGAPYNAGAKFYKVYSGSTSGNPDVRVSHVGIDPKHTTAIDSNTWFPLQALRRELASGRIGSISGRFHGVPTNRSQKTTMEVDAPEILSRCIEDEVDAVVLVPNCPVCHQSISLVARHLEENGISTVLMGAAKDIVEYCGVPRFVFSDFPLGNSAGRPGDPDSQSRTMELALKLLESAPGPRTTVQSELEWSHSKEWHLDYMNPYNLTTEELTKIRAKNDAVKETIRSLKERV